MSYSNSKLRDKGIINNAINNDEYRKFFDADREIVSAYSMP
jgi:hypothetical protein